MVLIQLVLILLFIFAGLVAFMRYILARNISRATGHIQELSQEYAHKQEEATKKLQEAKEEAEKMIADSRQQADQLKERILKEAEETKEKIILEAREKKKEVAEKAQRNYEFLQGEVEQRVQEKAKDRALELFTKALPEEFLKEFHQHLVQESGKSEFQLKRLNVPEGIKEVEIVTAFPLTEKQRNDLKERLAKQLNGSIQLNERADPALVAGFVLHVGQVVIDASLKNKIQKITAHGE